MAMTIVRCPACNNNEIFFNSLLLENHLRTPKYNAKKINCYNCKKEIQIKDCSTVSDVIYS